MTNTVENGYYRLLHKIYLKDENLENPLRNRDFQLIPGFFQRYSERFMQTVSDFVNSDRFEGSETNGRIEITVIECPDLMHDPVIDEVITELSKVSKIKKSSIDFDGIKINVYADGEECLLHRDRLHDGMLYKVYMIVFIVL